MKEEQRHMEQGLSLDVENDTTEQVKVEVERMKEEHHEAV